jgi:hypothetical protein
MPGARGLAMGGTGLTFTDIHASWSNPAGLGALNTPELALYGEQRFALADLKQISATGAFPVGNNGAVGLVLGYYGFEGYNEQRVGLLYGRKLSDKINLGAQVYSFNTRIPDYGSKNVVSFELGLQAEISPQIKVGTRMANPIRVAVLEDEYLPSLLAIGLAYQPGKQLLLLAEVEKDILFPVRVRVGLEYQLLDVLQLRMGVATQPALWSFGVGYKILENWRLDFAAAYHQYLGFTPGFSLVYRSTK